MIMKDCKSSIFLTVLTVEFEIYALALKYLTSLLSVSCCCLLNNTISPFFNLYTTLLFFNVTLVISFKFILNPSEVIIWGRKKKEKGSTLSLLNSLSFVKNKTMTNRLWKALIEAETNYIMKKTKLCTIMGY